MIEHLGSNSHWAHLIVEELDRCGCRYFVISPGSRSAPLVIEAARHTDIVVSVSIDERGAAFHALGYARASGQPAVIVCTSGTALANYLPAVVEAAQDQVPLIVLSADRPPELQDSGANQTIVQRGIFGDFVKWSAELPVPTTRIEPRVVLTTIDQAVFKAKVSPGGPVHVNCLFAEPLEPQPLPQPLIESSVSERWLRSKNPFTTYYDSPDLGQIDHLLTQTSIPLIDSINSCERGLIVAGGSLLGAGATIEALARHLGWPLLGDVTSGTRGTEGLQLLLQSPIGRNVLRPDFVLHFGSKLVSKNYLDLLQEKAPLLIQIATGTRRIDPSHSVAVRIVASPVQVAQRLLQRCQSQSPSNYTKTVQAVGKQAIDAVVRWGEDQNSLVEPLVARLVAAAAAESPPNGLFVANSMPIRDLDTFATPLASSITVAANRGVSGIDGAIASAAGFAMGLNRPVIAFLGDLSFLHDIVSLNQLQEINVGVVILVINNRGGGIFSLLPLAETSAPDFDRLFERYFSTPHSVVFSQIAASFSISYRNPITRSVLKKDLVEARDHANQGLSTLIEVNTERTSNALLHREIQKIVVRTINKK